MSDPEIDRSLIDAARPGLGPSAVDRARLRRSVMAAVASSAIAGGAVSTAAASAAAKGAGLAITWKIALAAVIASAVGGAAAWGVSEHREDRAEPARGNEVAEPESASATPPAPASTPASVPESAPASDLTSTPSPVPAAGAPAPSASPSRARGRASTPPAADAPSAESLAAETALLRDAHRARQAGDPARALALLDAHARRFPDGLLREERLATRVLALCDAARHDDARLEAERFLAAHPRSMHAARVRASCAF